MIMNSDGGPKPPLQLKLDTLLSVMPELDPNNMDLASVHAALAEAFVAEGLLADGTPPLVQFVKTPLLGGGIGFAMTVAPQLFAPGELDPLTATVLLSQLQITIDENAFKTGMLKIESDREAFEKSQKKSEQAMRDANDAEDRAIAAAKEAQASNIANAVMAIIGAIIGAGIAALFGGVVLGALAVLGAVMAMQEAISVGIKSNPNLTYDDGQGGKRHYGATFTDFIDMGSAQRMKDGNLVVASQNAQGQWVNAQGKIIPDPRLSNPHAVIMSPQQFKDMTVGTAIGLTVFLTLVMLSGGIYAIRNPSDIVKVAERLSKFMKVGDVGVTVTKAENIGTLVQSVETVGSSATQATEAGLNLKTSEEQLNLANANALKSYIQSMVNAQVQQMQMTQEFVKNLAELLMESLGVVAKAIGDTYQVQSQMAQNLAAPAA